jgi:transcriptional regulator with XRE-family HTH domain
LKQSQIVSDNRIIYFMNHIGLNIKRIREKWGLTQEEFAWLIQATRGMVMTYEVRGSKPRAATIAKVAKITGLQVTILIDTELHDSDIPEIPDWVLHQVEKGRKNPELMREATQSKDEDDAANIDRNQSNNKSPDYADKYVSLMESRLSELEQDKKFLQRMLELNLGKASVAIEKVLKLQTAHDDVMMKALDRLEKRPEGTLSGEADNLEMEIDQRLENLSDTDKKVVSNK